MQIIECAQNSDEWWQARLGLPTASEFDKIVTPPDYRDKYDCGNPSCKVSHTAENSARKCKGGTGKPTKSQDVGMSMSQSYYSYRNKLLGEWLRGKPDEGFQSEWMKRGHDEEGYARSAYLFLTDNPVKEAGFCLTDDGKYGCSPDGLIGDDGGLECKSPSPGVHVGYLLDGKVPTTYRLQILGSLLVTGREWWDFISHHPDMEPLIVRTYRKDVESELEKLAKALGRFCDDLDRCKEKLSAKLATEAA